MRRSRLLFFAKVPMNYVLFRPVHERLAGIRELEFFFTGKFQGSGDPKLVYRSFDLLGGRLIRNAFARWREFDVYVSPDYRLAGKRCRVKVHMFHGFSLRNFAIQERARDFDRLFLIGPYMRRRFVETGILAADDPRMVDVGMPKLDALVNGAFDRARVLEGLGLDPSRRTVVFAPTWVKGGCLDSQGHAILDVLGRLSHNVILKLHDNSFDPRKQRFDWASEIGARLKSGAAPRMAFAKDPDSNPCLAAADLLISDASSIANEFLLLDRPLVFFRLSELEADWPATDRATWGTNTGAVIDRAAELERAIEDGLAAPSRQSEIRRAAARDFFFHPGRAAEIAAKHLVEYAGVESP